MATPNFLCLGVQRAATTWLYRCLKAHPEVYLPEKKELHFFNFHWNKGMDWYEAKFAGAGDARAVGEITPNYLHEAPLQRIRDTLPEARIIVILREPLSRAYSAYRLLNEKFRGMSFEEACQSSAGDYLIGQSLYYEKLEELFSLYPRDQIMIQIFDVIKAEPERVFREVCSHLNITQIQPPEEVKQTFNHILYPRVQAVLRKMRLSWAVDTVKKSPLGDAIKRRGKRRQGNHFEKERTSQYLEEVKDLFDDDLRRVEVLIGRDLAAWMTR